MLSLVINRRVQQGFCQRTCFVTVLIQKSQQNEVLELRVEYFALRRRVQATSTNYWNTVESHLTISAIWRKSSPAKRILNTTWTFSSCQCRNTEKVSVEKRSQHLVPGRPQSGKLHFHFTFLQRDDLEPMDSVIVSYCLQNK